jgi:hypothetical protein
MEDTVARLKRAGNGRDLALTQTFQRVRTMSAVEGKTVMR